MTSSPSSSGWPTSGDAGVDGEKTAKEPNALEWLDDIGGNSSSNSSSSNSSSSSSSSSTAGGQQNTATDMEGLPAYEDVPPCSAAAMTAAMPTTGDIKVAVAVEGEKSPNCCRGSFFNRIFRCVAVVSRLDFRFLFEKSQVFFSESLLNDTYLETPP